MLNKYFVKHESIYKWVAKHYLTLLDVEQINLQVTLIMCHKSSKDHLWMLN